ncbi:GNAT family N-acetyltransferase [Paenibacillus sp. GYB003]|uniref:GNAT family N-acetyltransferase n=1 Tax=Paenibacillus sp. GYB003 TaxID=2994392 RepID=UPI002F960DEC
MFSFRNGRPGDIEFLARIDLKADGYYATPEDGPPWSPDAFKEHRDKIAKFVTEPDKGTVIALDADGAPAGAIQYEVANRDAVYPWRTAFHELDRGLFQSDGRFLKIFNVWVRPDCRRRGLATTLKRKAEDAAAEFGVNLVYTHTLATNAHVIELNEKMGYRVVRRGPIWDEHERVSLIKRL